MQSDKIQLFIPCFVDQMWPQAGVSMVKILRKINVQVRYNQAQTCCGQIAFNSGDWESARKMGTKFLNDFKPDSPIITPSASCSAYLKNYYSTLFKDDEKKQAAFENISPRIIEFSDYLVNHQKIEHIDACFPHRVTFHDSCSGLREYGLKNEARTLLKNVRGLELLEMKDTRECCGFGGSFSIKHKYVSQAMVQRKVENAINTGAEYITSTEVSCLLNIKSYIEKQGLGIKVVHFSEILEASDH